MNAAVLHALGNPPRFEQFPEPIPAEDEVFVHIRAAALKPVDKQIAAGTHYASFREFPAICGLDGVGWLDHAELTKVFARESGDKGFQVVIDCLWGPPTEALLAGLTRNEFAAVGSEIRLVQGGESAGPTISLPAAVLRSAPLTILGTAGMPAPEILLDALEQVLAYGASGKLRIDTERLPLADIESAWEREGRSRLVVIP
jgi:NADPH:quinone reductase-like Zn-dependent oxidoreductase